MRYWFNRACLLRLWIPGAAMLQLGGCLSDQQLTSIWSSVITTGLSALLSNAIAAIFAGAGTA